MWTWHQLEVTNFFVLSPFISALTVNLTVHIHLISYGQWHSWQKLFFRLLVWSVLLHPFVTTFPEKSHNCISQMTRFFDFWISIAWSFSVTTKCLICLGFSETLEPEVKFLSLAILSPGRSDIVLAIPENGKPKGLWFTLKEGSRYSLKFSFEVKNNIVSGLRYTNTVWKTGVKGNFSLGISLHLPCL